MGQVNDLIEYLDYYNGVHSEIHGMKRIDSRDCPVEALREAVFNAVKVILPNIHYEGVTAENDKAKESMEVYGPSHRNEDDMRVYEAIAKGVDSRKALQERMGFSLTKTINILRRLQDEGRILRIGKGKKSRYGVKD